MVVAVGDVSGNCRRRSTARLRRSSCAARFVDDMFRALEPGERARLDQHDPAPAPARRMLLHALLHDLRSQAPDDDDGEFGLAVSGEVVRRRVLADRAAGRAARVVPGSTYDEVTFSLQAGEVYVFCTDGVFEAMNELGRSSPLPGCSMSSSVGAAACRQNRLGDLQAVAEWRGGAPPNDDMTAVVVRITA